MIGAARFDPIGEAFVRLSSYAAFPPTPSSPPYAVFYKLQVCHLRPSVLPFPSAKASKEVQGNRRTVAAFREENPTTQPVRVFIRHWPLSPGDNAARPASNDPAVIPPSLLFSAFQPNIDFVHPGYDGDFTSAIFLSLPRLDDCGVCFDTALTACGIIACNQWTGFFSTDKLGQSRVDRPRDGILRDHPYYYFHLPASGSESSGEPPSHTTSPSPYPIVACFSDWTFPHHALFTNWNRLQLQTNTNVQPLAVGQCTSFCIATNYSHGVDVAHCVPSHEREWWDLNGMGHYGRSSMYHFSTEPQDSPANLVPLRSDFRRVFDERYLCFVPKEVEESEPVSDQVDRRDPQTQTQTQTRLLIHVFVPSPNGQVAGLWHNRGLHAIPSGLSKECLFARFAYTILSPAVFSSTFLSGAIVARRLRVREPETRIPSVRMVSPAGCRRILRVARSRGLENDDDDDKYETEHGLLSQFGPDPTIAMAGEEGEEERRGRGRKRTRE